jgi:hypothetical protein
VIFIALENVLHETEPSDKLSKIKKSDILFNTKSTSPSTGNAPNNSIVNSHCYMAEEVHVKTTKNPQSRNLTPVTIMVADTIGTIKSRRLLKVLLDSGSTTTENLCMIIVMVSSRKQKNPFENADCFPFWNSLFCKNG